MTSESEKQEDFCVSSSSSLSLLSSAPRPRGDLSNKYDEDVLRVFVARRKFREEGWSWVCGLAVLLAPPPEEAERRRGEELAVLAEVSLLLLSRTPLTGGGGGGGGDGLVGVAGSSDSSLLTVSMLLSRRRDDEMGGCGLTTFLDTAGVLFLGEDDLTPPFGLERC